MRYIVIFSDRTSKRVTAEQARVFIDAMRNRTPVEFRGGIYAGYSIVAVKPVHAHEQDLREEAADGGLFRCRYGRTHPGKSDCACRDAGFAKVLEAEEERLLLEEGVRSVPRSTMAEQDARTLGFTDAEQLHAAPSWTKAGDVNPYGVR